MLQSAYGLYNQTCRKTSFSSQTRFDIKCSTSLRAPTNQLSVLSALDIMIGFSSARSAFKARPQRPCKMTSISAHTNIQWHSTQSMEGANTQTHVRPMHQRVRKSKHYRSTYLSASIIFSTRIATYKKQGATD
jgi:hypothetical protein